MPHALVFNPGSASLKSELIQLVPGQHRASEATKLLSASIEEMGDQAKLLVFERSGLLGIAGKTFDTRDLVKRSDEPTRLAMRMFSYRVRLAVGAYLAALGELDAVVFGGGIGEDTPSVRAEVCAGLGGWGMDFDQDLNRRSTSGEVCLTRPAPRLKAHVVPVEEGLQIAHECLLEHAKTA